MDWWAPHVGRHYDEGVTFCKWVNEMQKVMYLKVSNLTLCVTLRDILNQNTHPHTQLLLIIIMTAIKGLIKRLIKVIYNESKSNVLDKSCVLQPSELQSDALERCKMFLLSVTNHFVIHAWSIALAVISQVTSDIFFVLAMDDSVPNGEWLDFHWIIRRSHSELERTEYGGFIKTLLSSCRYVYVCKRNPFNRKCLKRYYTKLKYFPALIRAYLEYWVLEKNTETWYQVFRGQHVSNS